MSRQKLLEEISDAPETKIQMLLGLLGMLFSRFDGSEISDILLLNLRLLFSLVGRKPSSVESSN